MTKRVFIIPPSVIQRLKTLGGPATRHNLDAAAEIVAHDHISAKLMYLHLRRAMRLASSYIPPRDVRRTCYDHFKGHEVAPWLLFYDYVDSIYGRLNQVAPRFWSGTLWMEHGTLARPKTGWISQQQLGEIRRRHALKRLPARVRREIHASDRMRREMAADLRIKWAPAHLLQQQDDAENVRSQERVY